MHTGTTENSILCQIKDYNPTFYEFVNNSFLKRIGATSKPSKFLACLVGLGIVQS